MDDPLDPRESEDKCYFTTSRGIAKSCKQHPVFLDHNVYHFNISFNSSYGESVYVPFKLIKQFLSNYISLFKNPIVLVVGDDDNTFPTDFEPSILEFIETNDKILRFYCQNCTIVTAKIKPIPIGIYYHTLCYKSEYNPCPISPLLQEKDLINILQTMKPLRECKLKCVTNFQHSLDMPRREAIRVPALNILKSKDFMVWLPRQSRDEFWKSLNEYAFVICPPGNGLDTHRLWEALVFNRIPITFNTGLGVYDDLPILQVTDWNIITTEWLQQKFNEICSKLDRGEYNMNKLNLKYWNDLINTVE